MVRLTPTPPRTCRAPLGEGQQPRSSPRPQRVTRGKHAMKFSACSAFSAVAFSADGPADADPTADVPRAARRGTATAEFAETAEVYWCKTRNEILCVLRVLCGCFFR